MMTTQHGGNPFVRLVGQYLAMEVVGDMAARVASKWLPPCLGGQGSGGSLGYSDKQVRCVLRPYKSRWGRGYQEPGSNDPEWLEFQAFRRRQRLERRLKQQQQQQ